MESTQQQWTALLIEQVHIPGRPPSVVEGQLQTLQYLEWYQVRAIRLAKTWTAPGSVDMNQRLDNVRRFVRVHRAHRSDKAAGHAMLLAVLLAGQLHGDPNSMSDGISHLHTRIR